MSSSQTSGAALGDQDDKAGLDFYFGRPTDMMRKLEASKFMNRGKAKTPASPSFPGEGDDYSQGMTSLSLQPSSSSQPPNSSLPGSTPSASELGEENAKTGGYLFKWQRDQRQEDGDEGEDDFDGDFPIQSPEANQAKHRARYQVVTGNTQPSSLSISGYFENNTIKGGKPIGRDGFVNCGGVILLPAAAGALNPFKQRLNFSELNEINRFETLPDADNLLSLRGEGTSHEDAQVELLFLRKQNQVWPPEAPGFPPPPPDDNENVQYKKIALASILQMQHQGGFTPVRRQSRHKPMDKLGEMTSQASFKHHPNGSRLRTQSSAMESPVKIKPIPEKTGFFSRMLPSSLTKQSQFDSSQFPGVYSSFVLVPYILPPPPQPPKFPAPGSNEEKRLQRFCQKKMFLEDQYSTILENVEERIRLNEVVREMEKQIMESDVQINQLIGQSDAS
ncbi:hypothetical protein BASA81_000403 [Batrachochytrium salamandrivorans]|nr:hypothetical protein BASA81_000403 [Batrachochytrium salamandrivorans]